MNTLLNKAKANPASNRQTITSEHVELAHAFIRGEVGITAVNIALDKPKRSLQGYITICRALRQAHTLTESQEIKIPPFNPSDIKKLCEK